METDTIPEDQPFLSLVIPFEPKMNSEIGFRKIVKQAVCKAENELIEEYSKEKAMPVIEKLRKVITNLKHDMRNTSIGIFVSPTLEKVYYFTYDDTLSKKMQQETGSIY